MNREDINWYLKIDEFKLYLTKDQKEKLDREFNFYSRYRNALKKEILRYKENVNFYLDKKEIIEICDSFKEKMTKIKFDYSKYLSESHFNFAKDNMIKAFTDKRYFDNIDRIKSFKRCIRIKANLVSIEDDRLRIDKISGIKIRPKATKKFKYNFFDIIKQDNEYKAYGGRFTSTFENHKTGKYCAIDIGLKDCITLYDSEGESFKRDLDSSHIEPCIERIRILRQIARNIEDNNKDYINSKNYKKISNQITKCYERIKNIRSFQYNQILGKIVKEYDFIAIEKVDMFSMYKHEQFRTVLLKYSFGAFHHILANQAKKHGKVIYKVDRMFPSSQLCSNCGVMHPEIRDLKNYHSEIKCDCGLVLDRDVNAAINLLNYMCSKLNLSLNKKEKAPSIL